MYLSKIEADISKSNTRAALRDCQKMHRLVNGLFDVQRRDAQVLYRSRINKNHIEIYMYSAIPVDQQRILPGMHLVGQRDISSWLDSMKDGDIFDFQITTAPFKKVAAEGLKNSQRRLLSSKEERLSWINRKAEQGGFQVIAIDEREGERLAGIHQTERGGRFYLNSYCYSGRLRIRDAELFRLSVRNGIGPGKAYGLGMLLLMRR